MAEEIIPPLRVAQAAELFNEIASLAHRADRFCYFNDPCNVEDEEQKDINFDMLRAMFSEIGLLADMGAEKINGMVAFGGAEEWLLSPCYQGLAKDMKAEEVSHA
jgi:hypothetical protein